MNARSFVSPACFEDILQLIHIVTDLSLIVSQECWYLRLSCSQRCPKFTGTGTQNRLDERMHVAVFSSRITKHY